MIMFMTPAIYIVNCDDCSHYDYDDGITMTVILINTMMVFMSIISSITSGILIATITFSMIRFGRIFSEVFMTLNQEFHQ